MTDLDLTDDEKRWADWVTKHGAIYDEMPEMRIVASALLKTLTRALKAEFWRYHDEHDPDDCLACFEEQDVHPNDKIDKHDPRHDYDDADWLAAARRKLEGK